MPVAALRAVAAGPGELARWRLRSQHLSGQALLNPDEVVGNLLAMQAQDYGQALWAIGARSGSATVSSIEKAVAAGAIIRTWPMRGTIHWVLPQDARWLIRLCGSRRLAGHATRLKQLRLTSKDIERAGELLEPELRRRAVLTRAQCMQVFLDGGLAVDGQRGYTLLWSLAHEQLICIGPIQGKQQSFVLLESVAPASSSRDLSGEEALAELAVRYVTGHGPVTAQDLAKWAGITLTEARRGIAAAGDSLQPVTVDDVSYLYAGDRPQRGVAVPDLLLPGFDEYLIGYRDRSAMLAAEHANAVVPGGNGVFKPMIVIDGQITGTWGRSVTARGVSITRKPFVPGGDDTAARLRGQAERYAAFLGTALLSL